MATVELARATVIAIIGTIGAIGCTVGCSLKALISITAV
jgi:hypothetical protein